MQAGIPIELTGWVSIGHPCWVSSSGVSTCCGVCSCSGVGAGAEGALNLICVHCWVVHVEVTPPSPDIQILPTGIQRIRI